MNFHNPAPTGYKLERLLVLYPDYASPVLFFPPFPVNHCDIIASLIVLFQSPKKSFQLQKFTFR